MVSCIMCGISQKARKFGITFHRLPKNPELRTAWLSFLNSTKEIPNVSYLCSQHFIEADFSTSPFKRLLHPNTIPSVHVQRRKYDKISEVQIVPPPVETVYVTCPSSREQLELVEDIDDPVDPMDTNDGSQQSPKRTSEVISHSVTDDTPRKVELKQQLSKISSINIRQSEQIRRLQKQNWFLKKRISKLTSVIKELKEKKN